MKKKNYFAWLSHSMSLELRLVNLLMESLTNTQLGGEGIVAFLIQQ